MKIANFGLGMIKVDKKKVRIEIPKSDFKYTDVKELHEIATNDSPDFLKITSLKEDEKNERVVIEYDVPENLKSVHQIKKEDLVVRLSIAKTILEQQPLENDLSVSINPATLFYRPMSTVKYTYRANSLMPREHNFTNYEKYKAMVLSLVSGYSYDTCLKSKEKLSKTKSPIILSIMESNNKEDLLNELEDHLDYIQYRYLENGRAQKFRLKVAAIVFGVVVLVGVIASIGLTRSIANDEMASTVATYESQIENQEQEFKLQQLLVDGEYEEAASLMQEMESSTEEIATMYVDANRYQDALNLYPAVVTEVIDRLYENESSDSITELSVDGNEEAEFFLEVEKAIVAYDLEVLQNHRSFVEDQEQAYRMGMAFINNGNVSDAEILLGRFSDHERLENAVTLANKNSELTTAREELEDLENKLNDLDDDEEDEEENLNDQINSQQQEVESLENEVENLEG